MTQKERPGKKGDGKTIQLTPGEEADRRHRLRQIYLRVGQAVMVVGGLVAVVHWLTHLEAFGPTQPPLWLDLAAGYPMGALLIVLGAVIASRKPKVR